jgi:hypothetical protein
MNRTPQIKSDTAPVVEIVPLIDFSRDKILIFMRSPLWHIHCGEKNVAMNRKLCCSRFCFSLLSVSSRRSSRRKSLGLVIWPVRLWSFTSIYIYARTARSRLREGRNIAFVFRTTEGKNERYSDLAAELVRLDVDIIVVGGNRGIRAAKKATSTIPIVMTSVGDPVGLGLVASLARPGGNHRVVANVPGVDRKTARAAQGNIAQGNASSLYSRPGQSWNDTEIQGGTGRGASIGDQVAIPRCPEF